MARVHGIFGQAAPGIAVLADAYVVPANRHATARVIVCNRSAALAKFRIALSPSGAAVASEHYIAYNQVIASNDSVSSVVFTVGQTDVVRVYSDNGAISFTVTGIEDDN